MIITNSDRYILIIDNQIERDEDHYGMVWGGVYYAYNHLAHILQQGIAKKSVQIVNVDTKDVIVSVDIKKVIKG